MLKLYRVFLLSWLFIFPNPSNAMFKSLKFATQVSRARQAPQFVKISKVPLSNSYPYPAGSSFLKSSNYVYHGIPFDPLRLSSIVKHGILSYNSAKEKGILLINNYGVVGEPMNNGRFRISVAQSPVAPKFYDRDGGWSNAFECFVKNTVSFIIDTNKEVALENYNPHGVKGELFSSNDIPLGAIVGVLLPAKLVGKRLSEISVGLESEAGVDLIEYRYQTIMSQLREETGYDYRSEILEKAHDEFLNIHTSYLGDYLGWVALRGLSLVHFNSSLAQYIEDSYQYFLNQDKVTIDDILKYYLPANLPIYVNGEIPSLKF